MHGIKRCVLKRPRQAGHHTDGTNVSEPQLLIAEVILGDAQSALRSCVETEDAVLVLSVNLRECAQQTDFVSLRATGVTSGRRDKDSKSHRPSTSRYVSATRATAVS